MLILLAIFVLLIMDAKTTKIFRKLLNDQLRTLLKEASQTIEGMSEKEKESFPDLTDQASAESDRSFLLRIRERERNLILKIREALERLERGDFGICESCGGKISKERLKVRPVTTLCIECKTEAEIHEKETA